MTITLKVGSRYVMRNGEVSPRMEKIHPANASWMVAENGEAWRIDGGHWTSPCKTRDADLISEYHESPAVDRLTGMPLAQGVPMIETGPRYKVGDRVCLTSTGECFEIFGAHFPDKGDEYCLQKPGGPIGWRKAEHLRHATPAEIEAADRPMGRVRRKAWFNVYLNRIGYAGPCREDVDANAADGLVGCIRLDIDIPEGTGLDGQEFVVRVSKP